MSMSKMWTAWKQRSRAFADRQPQPRKAQRRPRLFLEPLEDRMLLSAWSPIGPAPVVGEGLAGNTNSGRITGVAVDPNNAHTVYVAAAGGGIWKTTDAQDANPNWVPLTDNIPGTTDSMGAVAERDDSNGNQIVYAGTGEANNSVDSNYGTGILVSKNGGSTWTLTTANGAFNLESVSKIVIDPSDPTGGTAYAAMGNGWNGTYGRTGIWKTTNFGQAWTNTTASINPYSVYEAWSDVVIDPHTPTTVYAAQGSASGGLQKSGYNSSSNGVYKSINGGSSWSLLTNFPYGTSDGRVDLAISPSDPLVIYAAASYPDSSSSTSGDIAEVEESTDGGNTWKNLNAPDFTAGQGNYDLALAVDPTNASILYVGGSAQLVNYGYNGDVQEWNGSSWNPLATKESHRGPR